MFKYNVDKENIAVMYLRLSKEDGEKVESNSISKQREIINSYAKRNQFTISKEYVDQDYNVGSLRNYFGTLFQDFQVFAISLAENILMREIDEKINDEERVKVALNFVELVQKIDNLKNGVYTELTREFDNTGAIFSGGEYQKVAIARVFNRNSKVIILDEPSSALDPISEKELFDKINELASDKAVIFISHRLSNIINVDKILFLENGEIKERGTHSELMQMNGLYAEMYRIQADKYIQEIT